MKKSYKPWTPQQLRHLVTMKADGKPWDDISRRTGHPIAACQVKLSEVRRKERGGALWTRSYGAPVVIIPDVPAGATPVLRLSQHIDFASRIAAQGLTAGLCGDPLPGRSALDKRIQSGVALHPPLAASASSLGPPARDADAFSSSGKGAP
jgi:hypothetical protein